MARECNVNSRWMWVVGHLQVRYSASRYSGCLGLHAGPWNRQSLTKVSGYFLQQLQGHVPEVLVQWLVFLLRIREIIFSIPVGSLFLYSLEANSVLLH